jgi:microcystin-dependent protein
MTEPFVGEIRWLPFSRTPTGWLPCDGNAVPISEYETLYTLIGTTYGGDGVNSFQTPDLRGRVPIHQGTGRGLSPRVIGQMEGSETIVLQSNQAGHIHTLVASQDAVTDTKPAVGLSPGTVAADDTLYCSGTGTSQSAALGGSSLSSIGSGLPHENCAPTLAISAFICWAGIFPSQG